MKTFLARLLTAALILPTALFGEPTKATRITTLTAYYDLDGAASSATVIAAAQTIVDSSSYTIAAQPDTPRPVTVTLTDANSSISACTLTVVGTLADGTSVSTTTALTGGSGLKTLATIYNYKTITSASTGVCTGEGGAADTVSLGTSSTIPGVYPLAYGFGSAATNSIGSPSSVFDPFRVRQAPLTVSTSGFSTTVSSSTASSGALTPVDVGDIVVFNVKGIIEERVVLTNADNNTITVDQGINLTSATGYSFRKLYVGTEQEDGWVGVSGFNEASWVFIVTQMNGTGGITTTVACRTKGAGETTGTTVYTNSVTAAGRATFTLDLDAVAFQECRAGLAWGTNDDATDTTTAQEQITIQFAGVTR